MSLYDVALQMENDSRAFYLKQAEAATNDGLKQIFFKMADDEKRHYEYVRSLGFANVDFVETDVLVDVKNVFQKLLDDNVTFEMDLKPTNLQRIWKLKALRITRRCKKKQRIPKQ